MKSSQKTSSKDSSTGWARKARQWKAKRAPRSRSEATPTDFLEYREDPVGFARDVLGVELWDAQITIAMAVVLNTLVACRSGHKTGKSNVVAALAWWFVSTREGSRVVLTAPTDRQIRKVIWREIRMMRKRAMDRGYILPEVPKDPATGVQFEDGRELFGFSTNEPDNFSGISGAEVLYIVDEASGVPQIIFDAIHGNRAGGARMVMMGNPTQVTGEFYEAFTSNRHIYGEGALIHVRSTDSPNCRADGKRIPGLATPEWVAEMKEKYGGAGNPIYDVRVLGDFPQQSADSIISLALVEAAILRWEEVEAGEIRPAGSLDIGLDVARFGDDNTVAQPVRGRVAYPPLVVNGYDNVQVTGLAIRLVKELREPGERIRIKVDTSGGQGAGPYDMLRSHFSKDRLVDVVPIEFGSSPTDPSEWYNLRTELLFAVRTWLEDGGTFRTHPGIERDLVAPKYSLHSNGAKKAEPKESIKKRTDHSPDFFDALGMAVWNGCVIDPRIAREANARLRKGQHLSRWGSMPGRGF